MSHYCPDPVDGRSVVLNQEMEAEVSPQADSGLRKVKNPLKLCWISFPCSMPGASSSSSSVLQKMRGCCPMWQRKLSRCRHEFPKWDTIDEILKRRKK